MSINEDVIKKYLKPPTISQIFDFVSEVGVSYVDFERFYGMHKGILKNVKCGNKPLPRKHWWIFYERVIPTYGSANNFKKPKKQKIVSRVPKSVPPKSNKINNHSRLEKLKNIQDENS